MAQWHAMQFKMEILSHLSAWCQLEKFFELILFLKHLSSSWQSHIVVMPICRWWWQWCWRWWWQIGQSRSRGCKIIHNLTWITYFHSDKANERLDNHRNKSRELFSSRRNDPVITQWLRMSQWSRSIDSHHVCNIAGLYSSTLSHYSQWMVPKAAHKEQWWNA